MTVFRNLLVGLLPIAILAVPSSAHHSFAVNFNVAGSAELQGVLTSIRVRNPHSLLEMEVTGDNGETERWVVETHSVPLLARVDFHEDTFAEGEEIIVRGWPSRREDQKLVFGLQFVKMDGTVYEWNPGDLVAEGGLASAFAPISASGPERFEGVWGYEADPNPHTNADSPMPLSAEAHKVRGRFDPFNTSAMQCVPPNMPGMLYVPYLYGITVDNDAVHLHHEYFAITRTLPLSGNAAGTEPSGMFGAGRARFEGDTLIVETNGYPALEAGMATAFDPNGVGADTPSSAKKSVTEVYSLSDDGQILYVDYTITDPYYLTDSYTARTQWSRLAPGTEIVDFECDPEMAAETSAQDNI